MAAIGPRPGSGHVRQKAPMKQKSVSAGSKSQRKAQPQVRRGYPRLLKLKLQEAARGVPRDPKTT